MTDFMSVLMIPLPTACARVSSDCLVKNQNPRAPPDSAPAMIPKVAGETLGSLSFASRCAKSSMAEAGLIPRRLTDRVALGKVFGRRGFAKTPPDRSA